MLLSAASLVLQPFAQVGVLKYPPASVNGDQFLVNFYSTFTAVSYTHLTLPTILLV